MSPTLLALGLVLYPSTQLRFGGLPIGPGEFLLLAWLTVVIARQVANPLVSPSLALRRVIAFWFVLVVAQCLGMIVGFVREPFQDYVGVLHDVVAYLLLIILACLFAIDLEDPVHRRRVVWRLVVFGSASMSLQIGAGFGLLGLPGVDPWFYDRLRGWSLDPNQFGFLSVFLALLSVHLAETARHPREAILALLLSVPAFAAGVLSQSDTFVVALLVASAVFVVVTSITWLRNVEMGPTLRGATVVLGLLAFPLVVASVVPFWSAAVEQVEQRSADVYADDNQGDTRLHLWREALEKGVESGLVGYGPGPHLTSKSYKRPPPDKFEAHNTSLDLFTQGGLVALLAFVWLCASTLQSAWAARLPALAALTAGIAVFSMFHLVVRHPNFWFGIVFCLLEAARANARIEMPVDLLEARRAR